MKLIARALWRFLGSSYVRTYTSINPFTRVLLLVPSFSFFSKNPFLSFDSSFLFLVDGSDLYNHDSSVNLSLLSIDASFPALTSFFQRLPLFFSQLSLSESGCIFLLLYESGTISKTCFEYYVSTTYVPATFEYCYLDRYGINVILEMKDFDNRDFFRYENFLLK